MELHKLIRYTFLAASIATLAACDSADSTTAVTPTNPTPTLVTIDGSVFASDVNGATVTAKKVSDGSTVGGPVMSAADGSYSMDILDTDLATDLVIESTGGIFDDEETGDIGVPAGNMSAFVAGGTLAAGDSVHVTPDSTIHADLITKYNKTPTEAQTAFFNAFAHNVDTSVDPVDIRDPASFNADDASRHAGWRAAVYSRLANTLTLASFEQFDMFAAMAQDLSDGTMDAMDASGPVLIGTTGIDAPVLADYIDAAGSFTTAEAANLTVTYTPPMMNVHGKNTFTLNITDNNGAVTGLTDLMVMPMMYMADRTHATPVGDITELGGGDYQVTVYYLMPSRMNMNQTTMGTWDLKVMTSMKTVHFYPNINMAMGDTVRSDPRLLGIADTIVNMDGLETGRPYNIFRDGDPVLQGGGPNYDFDIFISPMETMMSFPPLVVGETLQSGMGGTPLDVTSVDIEVKVNDGGWDTTSAQPSGNNDGRWTLNTLQLNNGTNTIRFRLIVNGETKTTDGLALNPGVNDSTPFTVTLP
jgi:hypothetical protein